MCFLFISNILTAQNKINIGVEGGLSKVMLYGNGVVKEYKHFAPGYTAELSFQYNFTSILSIRSGLALERKGTAAKNFAITDQDGNMYAKADIRLRSDYLIVPILVRATTGKKVNLFVNAGPYVGCLLRTAYTYSYGIYNYPSTGTIKFDNSPYTKKYDWGASVGLGIAVPIKKLLLSLELRNNIGLYNISAVHEANADGKSSKTYSGNLLIGLAYKFEKTTD